MNIKAELKAFDDYMRYGTDVERTKAESSRREYLYTVQKFLESTKGETLTVDQGRTFIRAMEERGNAPRSVNRNIMALKSYFRFRGQVFPLRGLTTQQTRPRFLFDEEWKLLLDTVKRPFTSAKLYPEVARKKARLELALLYAFCGAGLRVSEGVAILKDNIDPKGYVKVMRKGSHEEYIPIEDEVLEVWQDYIKSRTDLGKYLFPGENGHMAVRTAQSIVKDCCRRAGLNDVHVHSLRHTAGYQMRNGGAPIEDVRDVLGHKNISTTQLYDHLAKEALRKRLPKRFGNG